MAEMIRDLCKELKYDKMSWSDLEVLQKVLKQEMSKKSDRVESQEIKYAITALEHEYSERLKKIRESVEKVYPFAGE